MNKQKKEIMMISKTHGLACIAMLLILSGFARAEDVTVDAALAKKAETAMVEGADYLIKTQNKDGSWGRMKHPAITALCVMALHQAPGAPAAKREAAINKALKYIDGFIQDNGAIFPAKTHKKHPDMSAFYPNYTTSVVLLCYATLGRKEYIPVMRKARAYLKSTQFRDKSAVDYGGIGYGKTTRADLSNGAFAAEALYYTEYLDQEPLAKDPEVQKQNKQMWTAMQEFLTKVQNLPETNKQPYVSEDPRDRGGFIYRPNESKAGSRDGKEKTTSLVSSGSMTYAGLKSMIYAGLTQKDPRVKAAMDYLKKNYTLTENPGMGAQGHYYYLHVMSRALQAYGIETITDAAGKKHKWREELIGQFLEMQDKDGFWVNKNGRYYETSPVLCTAYALISMRTALGKSPLQKPAK